MKKIEITINPDSANAKAFKRYMAEKAAFKNAVVSGKVLTFIKKSGTKFASPISTGK